MKSWCGSGSLEPVRYEKGGGLRVGSLQECGRHGLVCG